MTIDSQSVISHDTEITEDFGLWHFLAAVCWGSFTGTAAMMTTLPIAWGAYFDLASFGGALALVGLVVSTITLLAMLIIGLPLTLLLKAIERETAAIYASVGAFTGYICLALMFGLPSQIEAGAILLPLVGAFAGWVCALRWGRWRERRAIRNHKAPPHRRNNPIHDLVH